MFNDLNNPAVLVSMQRVTPDVLCVLQNSVEKMLPLKEQDKPVVQKLLAAGCCARCVLRFCCVLVQSLYRQPSQVGLRGGPGVGHVGCTPDLAQLRGLLCYLQV